MIKKARTLMFVLLACSIFIYKNSCFGETSVDASDFYWQRLLSLQAEESTPELQEALTLLQDSSDDPNAKKYFSQIMSKYTRFKKVNEELNKCLPNFDNMHQLAVRTLIGAYQTPASTLDPDYDDRIPNSTLLEGGIDADLKDIAFAMEVLKSDFYLQQQALDTLSLNFDRPLDEHPPEGELSIVAEESRNNLLEILAPLKETSPIKQNDDENLTAINNQINLLNQILAEIEEQIKVLKFKHAKGIEDIFNDKIGAYQKLRSQIFSSGTKILGNLDALETREVFNINGKINCTGRSGGTTKPNRLCYYQFKKHPLLTKEDLKEGQTQAIALVLEQRAGTSKKFHEFERLRRQILSLKKRPSHDSRHVGINGPETRLKNLMTTLLKNRPFSVGLNLLKQPEYIENYCEVLSNINHEDLKKALHDSYTQIGIVVGMTVVGTILLVSSAGTLLPFVVPAYVVAPTSLVMTGISSYEFIHSGHKQESLEGHAKTLQGQLIYDPSASHFLSDLNTEILTTSEQISSVKVDKWMAFLGIIAGASTFSQSSYQVYNTYFATAQAANASQALNTLQNGFKITNIKVGDKVFKSLHYAELFLYRGVKRGRDVLHAKMAYKYLAIQLKLLTSVNAFVQGTLNSEAPHQH